MPDAPAAEAAQTPATATQQPHDNQPVASNGDAKSAAPADDGAKKPSPAELKKQAKAEKQARRAQAKGPASAPNQQGSAKEGQKQSKDSKQAPKDDKARPMPIRRRPSQSNAPVQKEVKKEPKKDSKQAGIGLFFGHLYSQPKQQSMIGASKDVHPAVLSLGLQFSSYAICGSTARMVAMLLSFKAVIESYQTPPGTSLARHLTNHHLSPQIEYLRSCRPLSISMGNAIRWLKDSESCFLV
jgi:translation initiation factor eIF-2B subunit delta